MEDCSDICLVTYNEDQRELHFISESEVFETYFYMVQRSNSTVEDTYYIETQEIFLDVDVLVLSELTKLHSSNVFYVHMIREVLTETFTEEDDLDD